MLELSKQGNTQKQYHERTVNSVKPSEGAETQGYKNLLTRNDGIVLYALCTVHRTLFSFDIDVIELQTEQTTGLVGLFFL